MPRKKAVAGTSQKSTARPIDALVHSINSTYGEGKISLGNSLQFQNIPRISSGVYSLDHALGGGWPRGRIVQIHGPESSGKTYLAYLAAKVFSKHCQWCSHLLTKCTCGAKDPIMTALIDVEATHDPNWARKIGVNVDECLYLIRPDHGGQAIDQIDLLIRSGAVGLIILDSVAQVTPSEQLEKSAEDGMSPGALARLMSLGSKKWQAALNVKVPHPTLRTKGPEGKAVPVMWDNLCTLMCLNQLRESINRVPLPPRPPGGRALRHALSIDVGLSFAGSDIEFAETEDKNVQEAVQQTVHFTTTKNKTYAPRKSGIFTIRFADASVDNAAQIVRAAVRYGVAAKNGAWFNYGEVKAQGEDKFLASLEAAKLFGKMRAQVDAAIAGKG